MAVKFCWPCCRHPGTMTYCDQTINWNVPVSFTDLLLAEPSPQARRLLWHVLSVGKVWRDEEEQHAGADKAGLHLFWVERGSGVLETGGARHAVRPGLCCWLVDLRQPRRYLPDGGKRLVTTGFRFHGPAAKSRLAEIACFLAVRAWANRGDHGKMTHPPKLHPPSQNRATLQQP